MADDKNKSGDASRPGVMGDGTEEQNLNQPGTPGARITEEEVSEAFEKGGGGEKDSSQGGTSPKDNSHNFQ